MVLEFSFIEMAYGWLIMKVRVDRKYMYIQCDECLSDPLPNLVRMYNALKSGRDAVIFLDKNNLVFTVKFGEDTSKVLFSIESEEVSGILDERISSTPNGKPINNYDMRKSRLSGAGEFAVEHLLQHFEIFFTQIRTNRFYPKHYPCYCCLDSVACDKVIDEADTFIEAHEGEYDERLQEYYERAAIADKVPLTEAGMKFFKKFDEMLVTKKVPKGW